ncbi:MAG TPA: Ig domain-containing protein [Armatimonadota bacterium]|nr:Ig domain-containing protein [Armatimonadota bacterium]
MIDDNGRTGAPPAGLQLDPATGVIEGIATETAAANTPLLLRVTDARGRSDVRRWVLNPSEQPKAEKPAPPTGLTAVAGDGCITLSWIPSPSAGVAGYRLKRSTAPLAKQENRVYVVDGGPRIEPFDYVVVERRFGSYDMRYTHPRVRGIGNPMDSPNWHWRGEPGQVRFSLVPHPQPLPEAMVDPGETCLQVDALVAEEASINQIVFIGTDHGGESIWYGQLEPGRHYRLSVWLRQEGLANGGAVRFSYGQGYPGISHHFGVTNQWAEYTCEFDGPERPADPWHFGHTFTFTGPGTLWMDNCRIARVDRPEDATKPYVPNATVLDELKAASPPAGPKGMQRCWVLARDSTMDHLLSWYGNSQVRPDWSTSISGTVDMTMPQLLEFCRLTGPDPTQRVVPWIVIQHILHDEDDWLALVEYLAAPYDPAADSPETKPWAFRRFRQRGTGTPWIDEFRELIIEFGNETWHNGVFEDWLGFRTRNAVWQGGQEYGMFARYLIENMQRSPYWQQQKLAGRIRFALGDGYVRRDINGRMLTYGEEAMLECPQADVLAHANYVGPKWETGDASSSTFDDHGVQATLLAFQTGGGAEFGEWQKVRDEMAAAGHAYDLAAYESGPSGYTLPGQGNAEQVEVNERYGKSLAMGVAALDAWLGAYALGWTYQGFLGYGQGQYWNSHTGFSEGFRPCPGWQALALRNRFASGDMVWVGADSTPTLRMGEASYPLVGAYAFRDGDRWSVFVLSRKLDGNHDGASFGDGSTPVLLKMPFASVQRIELHRLTGDPRDSNRSETRIQPESVDVPAGALRAGEFRVDAQTGGVPGGMPPGSIYCYVFHGAR